MCFAQSGAIHNARAHLPGCRLLEGKAAHAPPAGAATLMPSWGCTRQRARAPPTHLAGLQLAFRADDDHLARLHIPHALKANRAERAVLRRDAVVIPKRPLPPSQHQRPAAARMHTSLQKHVPPAARGPPLKRQAGRPGKRA